MNPAVITEISVFSPETGTWLVLLLFRDFCTQLKQRHCYWAFFCLWVACAYYRVRGILWYYKSGGSICAVVILLWMNTFIYRMGGCIETLINYTVLKLKATVATSIGRNLMSYKNSSRQKSLVQVIRQLRWKYEHDCAVIDTDIII
jgi:hypothetical protein